jgi:hypothetical protein
MRTMLAAIPPYLMMKRILITPLGQDRGGC